MNFQTICCILNMIGLIGVIICIVILFKEKFNNTDKFGAPAPTSSTPYPGPDTGSHILLTDNNGNITKDQNSAILAEWVKATSLGQIKSIAMGTTQDSPDTLTINGLKNRLDKLTAQLGTQPANTKGVPWLNSNGQLIVGTTVFGAGAIGTGTEYIGASVTPSPITIYAKGGPASMAMEYTTPP